MESRWGFLLGRIIVGAYLLWSAFNHFSRLGPMSQYAAAKGVPLPGVAVAVTGVLLLIAGLSFLLGYLPRFGVLALVAFLLPTTFLMHQFWNETQPMARTAELVNFTKNLALLGSALMFLAIPEPWPASVAGVRERRLRPAPA